MWERPQLDTEDCGRGSLGTESPHQRFSRPFQRAPGGAEGGLLTSPCSRLSWALTRVSKLSANSTHPSQQGPWKPKVSQTWPPGGGGPRGSCPEDHRWGSTTLWYRRGGRGPGRPTSLKVTPQAYPSLGSPPPLHSPQTQSTYCHVTGHCSELNAGPQRIRPRPRPDSHPPQPEPPTQPLNPNLPAGHWGSGRQSPPPNSHLMNPPGPSRPPAAGDLGQGEGQAPIHPGSAQGPLHQQGHTSSLKAPLTGQTREPAGKGSCRQESLCS